MQHQFFYLARGLYLLPTLLAVAVFGSGCKSGIYQAANLPPVLSAPTALDLETINLSGLASSSVSVDIIQPGDVLDISIVNDFTKLTTATTPIRVADDGSLAVPLVGNVRVGGLDVRRAEQVVNAESITRGYFRTPCITLTMKKCFVSKVAVVGAVKKPGSYELPRGSTSLMAALVAAEGLSKEAGPIVEIRHTDSRQAAVADPGNGAVAASYQQPVDANAASPSITTVDLTAASAGGTPLPELHDGDVVNVTKRTLKPVRVIGLVSKQGEYAYPTNQEIRVLDALALAGGVSNPVAEDIIVIRRMPNAPEPVRIAVSLQAAKNGRDNIALAPGDTVSVERTPMTVLISTLQTLMHFSFGSSIRTF